MKKTLILVLVLVFSCPGLFAAVMEKEVVAEGVAAGDSLQARDSALARAQRNAIEQAVGVLVDSETMVENYELLDDKIYTKSKGYIKGYEVIYDNKGEGGLYKIKIKADVALGALTKEVKAMGILRERMKYPRIVVLIDEYIDGVEQPRNIVGIEMEKAFMKKDFPVVSRDQTEKIKMRDAALSYDDPQKAAALGRRYGAEVVIMGRATSDLAGSSQPYGVTVYAYEARAEARAVKADNAQVLALDTEAVTARGNGRVPTANKALSGTAEKLAEGLMKRIAESWRSEVYNERSIQLVCENADTMKAYGLKQVLKSMRDTRGVSERSLVSGVLELDVRFFGTTEQLSTILSEIKDPAVEITARTPNRIDIRFKR